MSLSKILAKTISNSQPQTSEELEIEKLKKLINGPLAKIQTLQEELVELEKELNSFFDNYYGSHSIDLKAQSAHNDNSISSLNIEQVKKNILQKIAKLCSKDNLHVNEQPCHDTLLKVEGYLNEGSEQTQSPQDQLSNLAIEYYNIIKQISEQKLKKPAHELKQAVMWINVKTSETIAKIREDIINRVNRPH